MVARTALAALRRSACIVMIAPFLLSACAGEYPDKSRDEEPVAQSDAAPTYECSAAGAAAICDPVGTDVGCASGACYVVKDVGSACVCNPGSIQAGEPCNTSIECAPGHVCAGTVAPGVCRRTCWSNDPSCGAGEVCTAIRNFSDFGYCEPE